MWCVWPLNVACGTAEALLRVRCSYVSNLLAPNCRAIGPAPAPAPPTISTRHDVHRTPTQRFLSSLPMHHVWSQNTV